MTEQKLPSNHVVGVIQERSKAEELVREAARQGFRGAKIMSGNATADAVDAKGERIGPLGRTVRAIQDHFSEETNYLAQYEEEAREGKQVVMIPVESQDHAEAANSILLRHGATNVRYFGGLAVADLTPSTNPSARSEESPERHAAS